MKLNIASTSPNGRGNNLWMTIGLALCTFVGGILVGLFFQGQQIEKYFARDYQDRRDSLAQREQKLATERETFEKIRRQSDEYINASLKGLPRREELEPNFKPEDKIAEILASQTDSVRQAQALLGAMSPVLESVKNDTGKIQEMLGSVVKAFDSHYSKALDELKRDKDMLRKELAGMTLKQAQVVTQNLSLRQELGERKTLNADNRAMVSEVTAIYLSSLEDKSALKRLLGVVKLPFETVNDLSKGNFYESKTKAQKAEELQKRLMDLLFREQLLSQQFQSNADTTPLTAPVPEAPATPPALKSP